MFTKSAGFLGGAVITSLGIVALWRTVVESPDLSSTDSDEFSETVVAA